MRNTRRIRRMERNRVKIGKMNLTSLMDVFTILVFFLLVNSGSVEVMEAPKTVELPESGKWEVRISHCYNVRRSTNSPITIHHAGGSSTIRINQQEVPEHGRLFRSLGTFEFVKETAAKVVISNDGTDPKKVVIADAVQFIKKD